jgi:hypothetical protein
MYDMIHAHIGSSELLFLRLEFPYQATIYHASVESACSASQRDWAITQGDSSVSALFQNGDNG